MDDPRSDIQMIYKQKINAEIKERFHNDSVIDNLPFGHVTMYNHISTAELAELPESEFNPLYEKLKTTIDEMLSKNIYSCYDYNDKWFNISFLHNAFLIRQSKT